MHPMPLFYGSSEKEVFIKICTTLGSPNKSNWHEGVNQASKIGMKYPQSSGTDLANIVIGASPEAIDLMKQMLKWSPNARATAANLLNHPFFNGCGYDLKRVTNSNFFNEFGDVKMFNKTNRRFRPNNDNNDNKNENAEKEKEKKKDNDDNMFSKLLNDTEGFNKLLNQLKKEENEENKNFEKNNYKFKNELKGEDKISKKPFVNKLNSKKIIDEEKENESDSENNKKISNKNVNINNNNDKYDDFNFDFNEKNNNILKDKDDDFNYLFNSDKKSSNRNFALKDNFRKDAAIKKNDEFDYLFNEKKSKEDKYDNLFKKNNQNDFSNIDSEINKILSKDIPLRNNNNNNFGHKNYRPNNNVNNDFSSNILKYKSQKISHNNNINGLELEKPYEISNLKPVVNVGRRAGGGLKALGYEPNRKSIFDDLNFGGGLGLNRKKETNNNKYNYGYKKDLGPIIMKEKKSDNYYGYNREDKFGSNGGNNYYAKKDKFNLFEKNNQLFNQFNSGGDIIGNSRRKRNFYSSPNNIEWDI